MRSISWGRRCLAVVLVLASLFPRGYADLPVHCLRHQVVGEWDFTLGPLGPTRSACGHQKPDDAHAQPPESFLISMGPTTTLHISLQDPDTASGEDGATGTWTMIYDEGFEVALGDQTYFAFSKFEYVDGEAGKTNVSHCDQTQIGWYHNAARSRWGCYFGKKTGAAADPAMASSPNIEVHQQSERAAMLRVDQVEGPRAAPEDLDLQNAAGVPAEYTPWVPGSTGYDKPMHSAWQQSVAEALNLMQLGWSAVTYGMFEGKTPRELNRYAGVRRSRPSRRQGGSNATSLLASRPQPPGPKAAFSSFLGIRARVHRQVRRAGFKETEIFDWRDRNGRSWLEPVVTQGDCGSCYTISTVHMLTARNRIRRSDANAPAFSVTFPLYCSEYNQGCDGGYGFLQSKWSEDVGLVPEACAPFSERSVGKCRALRDDCDLGSTRYRAVNHHYVGGFYGGSNEEQIRQELVTNGPLVMSFEPKEDFMYYKSGIYRSGPNKIHQEWEQVDHAVLLVGYGVENEQAYWSLQNSWGTDWGEDGYFRMARAIDESGCESIVVAADVVEDASNEVLDGFLASL